MTRLERRLWTDSQFNMASKGGVFDLFDNAYKEALRVNTDELDTLYELADEDDNLIDIMSTMPGRLTIPQKRTLIKILQEKIYK